MTPEEKARQQIDCILINSGWKIVGRYDYSPIVSAVAIEEGLLRGNLEADYLLFLDGKAIGVLEAKRPDVNLVEVAASQAENYTHKLPKWCQSWEDDRSLPLVYLSNGKDLFFRNLKDEKCSEYKPIVTMHTPKEMLCLTGKDKLSYFAGLPTLSDKGLRNCQFNAVNNLERSFREGHRRALISLATGAGKTFTACLAAYRMLSYTPARRVLFLVDRSNLGKQAEGEFGTFKLTETGEPFNTIFATERLKSNVIPADSNVVISTIQRLYAFLSGNKVEDDDEESEDGGGADVELPENPRLPKDYFDLVIIDECHRSIYGRWNKVLNYFSSARFIGLTATPDPAVTLPFFDNNRVANYTLEDSIADGINVDARIFRIKTEASENGGIIHKGTSYREASRHTGKIKNEFADTDEEYNSSQLDRSIVNPEQIRIILQAYKDSIYSELYPEREKNYAYTPKTLIFAKNDEHASNIVKILKEQIFPNESENFAQKITYSAGDSNTLIRNFRNDKDFRIAVTVTLVATGTDIKPLEVLIFMRDINSESLYVQMKGRGVRTIGDDALRNVTPNAVSKDLFYLIDAVGGTEHEKSVVPPPIDMPPAPPSLKELLEKITHGYLPDDYLRLLASRLSRINVKSKPEQRTHFELLSKVSIKEIAKNIFDALSLESAPLPEFRNVNEPNRERKALVAVLANNPKARAYLLELNAGFVKTLIPGEDTLISTGFSQEEAQSTTAAFEKYVAEHKDEIEALRIIYNNTGEPITNALLADMSDKLKEASYKFKIATLWNAYSILYPSKVTRLEHNARDALTNLIQLVRFAYNKDSFQLKSFLSYVSSRFNLWAGQNQRPLTETQIGIANEIAKYIAANGAVGIDEFREDMDDPALFARAKKEFDSLNGVKEMLVSLSSFILARAA